MQNPRPHVLTTYSGRQLDLDECTADAIFVEDIAGALSKICRFGAQIRTFYSVAQHALLVQDILVTDLGRSDLARYGLHHDSHEAFVGDLPSPLKAKLNSEGHGSYDRLCDQLDDAISQAFGFVIPHHCGDDHAVCKRADQLALIMEATELLHDRGAGIREQLAAKGVELSGVAVPRPLGPLLDPEQARQAFLEAHNALAAPASR